MKEMENMKDLVEELLDKYAIFSDNYEIKEEFAELNENLAVCAKRLQEFADSDLMIHSAYTPEIEERVNDCLSALGYAVMGLRAVYMTL